MRLFTHTAGLLVGLPALAGLVAGGMLLADYPFSATPIAVFLLGYAFLLWWRPSIWLLVVPALLPAVDLAPWSGSMVVEEFDFLLLVTVCVGYARLYRHLRLPRWSITTLLFAALGLSYAWSVYAGWTGSTEAALWTADYLSPTNSWRVGRGFLWVVALAPLLAATVRHEPEALNRWYWPGVVTGLALLSLNVVWERAAFTGLLDFAQDYRVTAGLSGMHVGGAALDGLLALMMPFVAGWILTMRSPRLVVPAALVFIVALYALLVTYSRGLYLAVLVSAVAGGILFVRARGGFGRAAVVTALTALCGWTLLHAFSQGGVRVLAVATAALCLTASASAISRRILSARWYLMGLLGFGLITPLAVALNGKAAYAVAAIALVVASAGAGMLLFRMERLYARMASAGAAGLLVAALGVAFHHNGWPAVSAALGVPAAAVLMLLMNRTVRPRLWEWNMHAALLIGLLGVLSILAIPVVGNYYMGSRIADTGKDWKTRVDHWKSVLEVMPSGTVHELFGAGSGRMPEYYFWKNPKQDVPGNYHFVTEGNDVYLELGAPRYERGFGEALRFGQRIEPSRLGPATLSLRARGAAEKQFLYVEICEKLLIYSRHPCVSARIKLSPEWKNHSVQLPVQNLGKKEDWLWRPVQFSLYNELAGSHVDVDDVMLVDAMGENVIRNGGFSVGHERWFFSSDHHHLPWHAKDMGLHLYFEQGWVGVALFTMLVAWVVFRLAVMRPMTPLAHALMAGVVGFVVVGLFDSLLDMPRVAVLFFLSLAVAAHVARPVSERS